MNWFKRKKQSKSFSNVPVQNNQSEPRVFGKTNKKKNTYVTKLNNIMCDMRLFDLCRETPMPVVMLNGKVQQEEGFLKAIAFPNPGATIMVRAYSDLVPYMGQKLASSIVEYNDKADGKTPVLTLFPQNQVFFNCLNKTVNVHIAKEDGNTVLYLSDMIEQAPALGELNKLNHQSRQDLFRQVEMRQRYIEEFNKNRAR